MTRGGHFLFWFVCLKFPLSAPNVIVVLGHILSVDIEVCSVLPLRPMDAYPNLRYLVSLDAEAGVPYHCDGDPTPYIAACNGLRLTPLGS